MNGDLTGRRTCLERVEDHDGPVLQRGEVGPKDRQEILLCTHLIATKRRGEKKWEWSMSVEWLRVIEELRMDDG